MIFMAITIFEPGCSCSRVFLCFGHVQHSASAWRTIDGAVWITHLKAKNHEDLCDIAVLPSPAGGCKNCEAECCVAADLKLPAAQALGAVAERFRKSPISINAPADYRTFREIRYWEMEGVGYIASDFYNGAMSTDQCYRRSAKICV